MSTQALCVELQQQGWTAPGPTWRMDVEAGVRIIFMTCVHPSLLPRGQTQLAACGLQLHAGLVLAGAWSRTESIPEELPCIAFGAAYLTLVTNLTGRGADCAWQAHGGRGEQLGGAEGGDR